MVPKRRTNVYIYTYIHRWFVDASSRACTHTLRLCVHYIIDVRVCYTKSGLRRTRRAIVVVYTSVDDDPNACAGHGSGDRCSVWLDRKKIRQIVQLSLCVSFNRQSSNVYATRFLAIRYYYFVTVLSDGVKRGGNANRFHGMNEIGRKRDI